MANQRTQTRYPQPFICRGLLLGICPQMDPMSGNILVSNLHVLCGSPVCPCKVHPECVHLLKSMSGQWERRAWVCSLKPKNVTGGSSSCWGLHGITVTHCVGGGRGAGRKQTALSQDVNKGSSVEGGDSVRKSTQNSEAPGTSKGSAVTPPSQGASRGTQGTGAREVRSLGGKAAHQSLLWKKAVTARPSDACVRACISMCTRVCASIPTPHSSHPPVSYCCLPRTKSKW